MIFIRKNNGGYANNITYKAKTLETITKYFSLLLGVDFKAKTLDELLDAINAETEMTLTDWSYVKASRSGKKTYIAEEQIPLLEKGLV